MILRAAAVVSLAIALSAPACAQQAVTVGAQRLVKNGALFLAAAQGYFKAEGLDLEITLYPSEQAVLEAVAEGVTDLGLAGLTPAAFDFAGRRMMKAVAAQVREKRDHEGAEVVVSNRAYAKGVRKLADLDDMSVAVSQCAAAHYRLGQIARAEHIDFKNVVLKPMPSIDAMVRAIGGGAVDAALMPARDAHTLLAERRARVVSWYSDIDEQQLGALFASARALEARHSVVAKFVRAYRRGAADYAELARVDELGRRVETPRAREVAAIVARYAFPGQPPATAAAAVMSAALYMDPQARLDMADLARQVAWYKTQGLIDSNIEADKLVDLSFSE